MTFVVGLEVRGEVFLPGETEDDKDDDNLDDKDDDKLLSAPSSPFTDSSPCPSRLETIDVDNLVSTLLELARRVQFELLELVKTVFELQFSLLPDSASSEFLFSTDEGGEEVVVPPDDDIIRLCFAV